LVNASATSESNDRAINRTVLVVLLSALLAIGFLFQGSRGVFETTEGRYSSIASEMIRLEDWIVPHLDEETPHFTKPPLTYWLLAVSIEFLGRSELAVRIPGAIAFVLTVLLVARAGNLIIPGYPWLAAIIYGSFLFPASVSNVVSTDNLLTFAEVAAMVCFAEHYFGTRRYILPPAILGWAFFGLAFLTKGFPALLPIIALATFHYLRGRHRPDKALSIVPGLLIFAALGASWFILVIWREPSLLHYFVADELYGRIAGEHNRNPEWYKAVTVYGPVILLGTIPWTLHTARAVGESLRKVLQDRRRDRALTPNSADVVMYFFLWLMIPALVFLMARSRLELYLLPQFAPLAILTALSLSARKPRMHSLMLRAGVGFALVLALRIAAAGITSHNDSRTVAGQIVALPGDVPSEVIFVESAPYRGIAFYLGCEVEQTALSRESAGRLGIETVHEELHNGETDRMWLVPVPLADKFRAVANADGVRRVRFLGEVATDQQLVAFVLQQ
jgi:4-amino-4-deoxy-L-arabinose transferase